MSKAATAEVKHGERAGTVEIPVTVNGVEYFAYMCPGACNLRSFHGLNQITKSGVHPRDIIAAIVLSGIGGSIMIFTDAYGKGEDCQKLKEFVKAEGLGNFTISAGSPNQYMGGEAAGSKVVTGVFEYSPKHLMDWYTKQGNEVTKDSWFSNTDRFHMDSVFYQFGGRPKPGKYAQKVVF